MDKTLDIYTDYLLSTVGQATGTGLSSMLDGLVSHDEVTRMLNHKELDSKYLWRYVKPLVREHESDTGCLIFDDSIISKPYSSENHLISWHYDHSQGCNIKGVNILSGFYHTEHPNQDEPLRIPVCFELILKTIHYCDIKTKKEKRKSSVTKNELLRAMTLQCISNQLQFSYVLADSWFASTENMSFINKRKKWFIFDMKSNRKAVLNESDRDKGEWKRIDEMDIPENTPVKVWLKGLKFPVLITKQVFKNKNASTGTRFLVSNNLNLSNQDFTTIYKKRWSVEEYHKSTKQNAALAKSPARKVNTQSNHIAASLIAYVKLEKLKFSQYMNHFAIKTKIHIVAAKAAFKELAKLKKQATFA